MHVGRKIRLLREERGLTQTEFGRRCGVSQQYVAALEGGRRRPSLKRLERIAAEFGVPVPWFFSAAAETWALHLPPDLVEFINDLGNLPFLLCAKRAKDEGFSPEALEKIVDAFRDARERSR